MTEAGAWGIPAHWAQGWEAGLCLDLPTAGFALQIVEGVGTEWREGHPPRGQLLIVIEKRK